MMYKIHFISTFDNILIIHWISRCSINKCIDIFMLLIISRRRIYIEKFIERERERKRKLIQSIFISKILCKNDRYYLGFSRY